MPIHINNKRRSLQNIQKDFQGAAIIDVTSKASDDFVKLSPFYPHGGIPVPFSPKHISESVEGIWQGLKVFENYGVDTSKFEVDTMRGLKRTVRKFGRTVGHQQGVINNQLIGYLEARRSIFIPSYEWILKHKATDVIEHLESIASKKDVVLLDYETNTDVTNLSKPLSHAGLVKYYLEHGRSFEGI